MSEATQIEKTQVSPLFECEHEQFHLSAFQQAGHFVPGMRDQNGFRREWESEEVHILTLRHKGEQVLRILADSREEAGRLMESEISSTLFALWLSNRQIGFNHSAWVELNDQRNQFQAWLNAAYSHEIETGRHQQFHSVFDAAVNYMRKERSRLRVRIGRWLRREKTVQQSDWVPQEWKQ